MRETIITVAGNVGGTPTFFEPKDGEEAKLVLSMATTPRFPDRNTGEWRDGHTSWYDVWLRGRLAVNAQQSIAKGDAVLVSGNVEIRPWQDGEKSGKKAVISARAFGPDLSKYPATLSRVRVATSTDEGAQDEPGDSGTSGESGTSDPASGASTPGESGTAAGTGESAGAGESAVPGQVQDVSGFAEADEDGNPIPPGDDAEPPQRESIVGRLVSRM